MTVYETIAAAIETARDATGYQFAVYANPSDNVEVPCIQVHAGRMEPSTFGGNVAHTLRVNAIALRPDVDGALELADAMAKIIRAAAAAVPNAAWKSAGAPLVFSIGGVDYLGRENTIVTIESCTT